MVDGIRPTYPTRPTTSSTGKVKESSQVETHNDDKEDPVYVVNVDRRKNKDRRQSSQDRPMFDMRSGRGRRKEDGNLNIEIKI